jgi:predicted ester cyclase
VTGAPGARSPRARRVVEAILAINERVPERTWIGDAQTTLVDMATGEVVRGPDEWYAYLAEWYRGFPDGRVEVLNVVDGGDQVVVEYTGEGTHLGVYYGMAPTGRRSLDRICQIYVFDGDRLREMREYWDQMSMLVQLGLSERPSRETGGTP